jgi:hypothetical protein
VLKEMKCDSTVQCVTATETLRGSKKGQRLW